MKAQASISLLQTLTTRFEKNMQRHEGIAWADVRARLEASSDALKALRQMEATGGEPDVIGLDKNGKVFACHNGAQSYYAARGFRGLVQV